MQKGCGSYSFWWWRMLRPVWSINPKLKHPEDVKNSVSGQTLAPVRMWQSSCQRSQQMIEVITYLKLLSWQSSSGALWLTGSLCSGVSDFLWVGTSKIPLSGSACGDSSHVGTTLKVTPLGWVKDICPLSLIRMSNFNFYLIIISPISLFKSCFKK